MTPSYTPGPLTAKFSKAKPKTRGSDCPFDRKTRAACDHAAPNYKCRLAAADDCRTTLAWPIERKP